MHNTHLKRAKQHKNLPTQTNTFVVSYTNSPTQKETHDKHRIHI